MTNPTLKTCTRCRGKKDSLLGFSKDPATRDGRRTICRDCIRVRDAANPEAKREYNLIRRYGISLKDYDALLTAQCGRCALCQTPQPKGRWSTFVVDHCHATGRVRGLLCAPCNSALGKLGDTPEALLHAYRYVAGLGVAQ